MKVLITGGAGFIGYHLAKELLEFGYNIVLIDDFSRGVKDVYLQELENSTNVQLISMDLLDRVEIDKIENDYDYIYHLAAIIGVQNVLERSYDVLKNNVELLINMIEVAQRQKHLRRFIFASTSEIYAGTLQFYDMEIPTPETTPLTITPLENPRTSYMLSKIYGEALLRQSKIPYTIIRPHNFYGPRMGMSHVIPELLNKAHNLNDGEELTVYSVMHKRTFCYISDAVRMIRMLAENDCSQGEAYNVGNEYPEISILEVAEIILDTVGKVADIDARPATLGSPERRCPSMKKTSECVRYSGEVSIKDGIKATYDWYKDNIFEGNGIGAK